MEQISLLQNPTPIMKQQSTTKLSKQNPKIQTIDGPPLDFSFKNMRTLNQLIQNIPSTNLTAEIAQQKNMMTNGNFGATVTQKQSGTNSKNLQSMPSMNSNASKNQQQKQSSQEPKLQIIRTIQTTDHNYLQSQQKKVVNKKQSTEKKIKKIISPQTTSLFLRYNKLESIENFMQFVQPIFPNMINNLLWVDLSHNRLVELSEDLGALKNLKTLYLHANYISNFAELEKVRKATLLRTLTIHANPLQQYGEFRIIIYSILPGLKKIDSTLLTKRQWERAQILMKTVKKYPIIKNAKKPPEESENQEDDQ